MSPKSLSIEEQFRILVDKIAAHEQAVSLMEWDAHTIGFNKNTRGRSRAIGVLATQNYNLLTAENTKELLDATDPQALTERERGVLEHLLTYSKRLRTVSYNDLQKYEELTAKARKAWLNARKVNDFQVFRPHFSKLLAWQQRFAHAQEDIEHPYDAVLASVQPGLTVKILDELFAEVESSIPPLIQAVKDSDHKVKTGFLFYEIPAQDQAEIGVDFLHKIGVNLEKSHLAKALQSFTTTIQPGDVRIALHYEPNDWRQGIFSTLAQGGEALDSQRNATALKGMTSPVKQKIHALLWSNFIGKSRSFWSAYYDKFLKHAPASFQKISFEHFYEGINAANPTIVRAEANELSILSHLQVRYELEKGLFEGKVAPRDLPELWAEKIRKKLGLLVPHDNAGLLQEFRWASGQFGDSSGEAFAYSKAADIYEDLSLSDDHTFDPSAVQEHPALQRGDEELLKTGNTKSLSRYLYEKYTSIYQIDKK